MPIPHPELLNQVGLVAGLVGALLLFFATPVGVVSKNGSIVFQGLDPMDPAEDNVRRVVASHRRNRLFTPMGWALVTLSFLLQFVATLH